MQCWLTTSQTANSPVEGNPYVNEQSFLNIPARHLFPKILLLVHFYEMLDLKIVAVRSDKHATKISDHF